MTQLETRDTRNAPSASSPPASDPLLFAIGGAVVGAGLMGLLSLILDPSYRDTPVWQYGRYGGVALFTWLGHLVGTGRGKVVAENIECLAIAVVMALVLKYFLIEAYKIPTGSMQPTILGNEEQGIFDRVLVNKFAYLVDEPRRYDVIVFKYPLDRSLNYIKRLVGLPGERVMVFKGDLYTAVKQANGDYGPFHIARKPQQVRDSVLKTLFPSGRKGETFATKFQTLKGTTTLEGDDVVVAANTKFRYGGGESIQDGYLDGYDPAWGITSSGNNAPRNGTERVSDLAIRCRIEPDAGCREVRFILFANSLEHRVVFTIGGGVRIESGRPTGDSDGLMPAPGATATTVAETKDVVLEGGKTHDVGFFHVDRELRLEVDGDVVLDYPYELTEELGVSENAVEAEVRGGGTRLSRIKVQRDIYYTTSPHGGDRLIFDVPEDSLFAMGDNTQNSSDGRAWHAETVRLGDGLTTTRDADHKLGFDPDNFTDIYGEPWHLHRSDHALVQGVPGSQYNFVPRKLLLGKAIAVFWPIYPQFRWKLIH